VANELPDRMVADYIAGVIDGSVVACELVKAACVRHVKDLERVGNEGFPYYFDSCAAGAYVDYFPIMLCHSIGDSAGKPFRLEPWQAFGIWSLFGWKRISDKSRRFRRFFWSMARKNGKSTLGAGLALAMASIDRNPATGTPESVAEVILCATKREQVEKVMYAEIERMRHTSPLIREASTRINKQVTFGHNQGSIRCVGSDKPYDGLNPHCVIMDEKHAWQEYHRKFYDTMVTGSGNRVQPLIGDFTTAGDDSSQLWKEDYEYASKVARAEIKDETYFAYIFEIDEKDDALDEANWPKANPNIGVSIKLEYLREQATKAAESQTALLRFTRYHGNRKVSSASRFINPLDYERNTGPLSDWKTADCITAGIDLGGRDDLASWAKCARFPHLRDVDGKEIWRYEISTKNFIVEDTTRDLTKVPWADWVYDGKLALVRYVVASLRDDLLSAAWEIGCKAVAYDPYNAAQLGDELSEKGLEVLKMPQNCYHFHEPLQEMTSAIREGRVTFDAEDDVLRFCMTNMMVNENSAGRMMPDKKNSAEKIDAAVAALMALRLAMLAPSRPTGALFIA
jgi:phage terminase large subunit-like protein